MMNMMLKMLKWFPQLVFKSCKASCFMLFHVISCYFMLFHVIYICYLYMNYGLRPLNLLRSQLNQRGFQPRPNVHRSSEQRGGTVRQRLRRHLWR